MRLTQFTGVNAFAHLLPRLIGLLAGECQTGRGIGAQAQRFASTTYRVVEAPAMGASLDEQQQVQTAPSPRRWRASPGLMALIVALEGMRCCAMQ